MQLVRAKKRVQPLFSALDLRQFPNHHACDAFPRNGERVVAHVGAGQRRVEIGAGLQRLVQLPSGEKIPACRACEANELFL